MSNTERIQYWGMAGITQPCLDAITRLLQYGDSISRVRILTNKDKHALLVNVDPIELIVIRAGFASGYSGEGPRKFSYALALLQAHNIEIDEYEIKSGFMNRLDKSELTDADMRELETLKPVRPLRLYDYIWEEHLKASRGGHLWHEFRPVIPFAIIDNRIIDLAITFWQHPDTALMNGYRRFEDIVRNRISSKEIGVKLFNKAFLGKEAKLQWEGISEGESVARASLISSAYSGYRNPRAHQENEHSAQEYLSEFLLLNHLFRLEAESTVRSA